MERKFGFFQKEEGEKKQRGTGEGRRRAQSRQTVPKQIAYTGLGRRLGGSAHKSLQLDVTCCPAWEEMRRGVYIYIFE